MRTVDAVMAIPGLLLALLLVTTLGKGSFNAMLAIAIAFAPGMARVTRSVALDVAPAGLREAPRSRAAKARHGSCCARCCRTSWRRW